MSSNQAPNEQKQLSKTRALINLHKAKLEIKYAKLFI